MHKQLLASLKKQKDNPFPTPPIGWMVQWFDRNRTDECSAALVTNVQGPGKLELTIFKPRHFPIHKQGVLHRSHPSHLKPSNPNTVTNGSWEYLPMQRPHKAHYELHLAQLEAREDAMLEEERNAKEAAQSRKRINQEIEEELATNAEE